MKRKFLLSVLSLFLIYSCKKEDKPEPINERAPEIIITEITSQLSNADSISAFTSALQNIALSKEETAEGITLFAPLNTENGQISSLKTRSKSITTTESVVDPVLPDSVVRNHIVKGVHKLANLTNNKVLTGLNGKQMKITRSGDTVWINGVLIGGKEIISNNNQVVYVVKTNLSTTTVNDRPYIEQDFLAAIFQIENAVAVWHKNQVLLDALLSHDVDADSISSTLRISHSAIGNFQFNSATQPIVQMWQIGYQHIHELNQLEKKAAGLLSNKLPSVARVKALRAYVYLQLLTYFGNIPLQTSGTTNLTNTNRQSVYNYIVNELQSAKNHSVPSVNNQLNRSSVNALLAKAALLEKDYQKVLTYTNEIINSGEYPLSSLLAASFTSQSERIWNNSENMNPAIKSFFYNRANLPYLRITEIYLMNTEAYLEIGNVQQAQNSFSPITQRRGVAIGNGSINELRSTLRTIWSLEMKREGSSFANLVRWNTASDILAPKGFLPKHIRLPIPAPVLDMNPGLIQNPQY